MEIRNIFQKPTKYIIFSGGGARGLSFVGAIRELEKYWGQQFWSQMRGIVCVSVGSIIACLLAIGFTTDELLELAYFFPFNRLISPDIDSFFERFGCDDGHQLIAFLTSCFNQKHISPAITFQEFYKQTNIDLQVTVSNLHLGRPEFWSAETTPDCTVITGIRASTAIPFIFQPIKYNNELYVDGGYFAPFPFSHLSEEILDESCGLYITSNFGKSRGYPEYPRTLWDYFNFCYSASRRFLIRDAWETSFWSKTIVIEVGDEVRISDFDLDRNVRETLILRGKKSVEKYFLRKVWNLFSSQLHLFTISNTDYKRAEITT